MLLETVIGLLSGLGGALAGAGSLLGVFRRPVEALKERVQRIEDEQLRELRAELKRHMDADQSQRMLALLEGIAGNVAQMAGKLDVLGRESSSHQAQITSNRQYIENLDKALERHKNHHHEEVSTHARQ